MNQRQSHNLLAENIQLKAEKLALEKKITDLMTMLDSKMTQMVDALNTIKDKPNVTITESSHDRLGRSQVEPLPKPESSTPIFIPTPDSSSLKMNVQDLQKKTRPTNIEDSLNKLSKLQDKP